MSTWRTLPEKMQEWSDLLDIPLPECQNRPRTDAEDLRLTELTSELYPKPEPLLVEVMRAQLDKIMADLDEPLPLITARELMLQAIDLQAAIERENGAFDNRYDAIICAKHGVAL